MTSEATTHRLYVEAEQKLVACFVLEDVLEAHDFAIVKPFLRATFTETWAALCNVSPRDLGDLGAVNARVTLRSAARLTSFHPQFCKNTPEEGREIELRLIQTATYRGIAPVLGPARKP